MQGVTMGGSCTSKQVSQYAVRPMQVNAAWSLVSRSEEEKGPLGERHVFCVSQTLKNSATGNQHSRWSCLVYSPSIRLCFLVYIRVSPSSCLLTLFDPNSTVSIPTQLDHRLVKRESKGPLQPLFSPLVHARNATQAEVTSVERNVSASRQISGDVPVQVSPAGRYHAPSPPTLGISRIPDAAQT